jgi:hypothetical protein
MPRESWVRQRRLTLNAEAFAVVPIRPLHMLHVGIATPVLNPDSRLMALVKSCLREEARSIKQRLTLRFGNLNAARNREANLGRIKPSSRTSAAKTDHIR